MVYVNWNNLVVRVGGQCVALWLNVSVNLTAVFAGFSHHGIYGAVTDNCPTWTQRIIIKLCAISL